MERLVELEITLSRGTYLSQPIAVFGPESAAPLSVFRLSGSSNMAIDARRLEGGVLSDLQVNFSIQFSEFFDPLRILETNSTTITSLTLLFSGIPDPPSIPIYLPNLRILRVTVTCIIMIPFTISCPNLEEFVVHGGEPTGRWKGPTFSLFDLTSEHLPWRHLRVLVIFAPIINILPLRRIISSMPATTKLIVRDRRISDRETMGTSLVRVLTEDINILPNLSVIRFFFPSPTVNYTSESIELLESLWKTRPSLRVEWQSQCLKLSSEDFDHLKSLNEDRLFLVKDEEF